MYQPLRKKTSGLMYLGLALGLAATSARADFNPIPLTPGSFNADVVVEKTATKPLPDYVSVTIDNGTNVSANTFFERGYHDSFGNIGLPANLTFSALSNASYSFTMPPTYTTNNVLYIGGSTAPGASGPAVHVYNGTLTVDTPTAYAYVAVLYAGGGSNYISYAVNHASGAPDTGAFGTTDWFNTSVTNVAFIAAGRVDVNNGSVNTINSTTQTKLFYADGLVVANSGSPITSIDFTLANAGLGIGTNRTFIFGLAGSTDGITYTPIPVSGFNKDVVVEATAPRTGFLTSKVTVSMDGGTNLTGSTWYEKGANPGALGRGIPVAGSTFTNAALTRVFKMPPSYTANNCVFIGNYAGYTTATLTLAAPTAATGLSFLGSCASAPLGVNWTVHHADTSTESSSAAVAITDWFNAATAAYWAQGRLAIDAIGFNSENNTSQCKLYSFDIAFTTPNSSPVTSVDFTYASGGGRGAIFALSAQTNSGGIYFPLNVTGFNADAVVEASAFAANPSYAPFPAPLIGVTTVSMDGGTNNTGNTWYEQGYFAGMPGSGLPPAGSTINSISLPDHHYQMPASYTANNCVFVDSAHTNWNVTPASPAWYSALSFLSATANGRVTNQCIIQYSDGTADTNVFISQDWFNNNPYAFVANGRVDLGRRTINTDPGHNAPPSNPRFYEAQFALKGASDLGNTSYQVTNVILQFLGAQNATSGRMVAMAVSGTTGPVAPVIRLQPGNITTVEGSNIVMSVVMGGGTPPFTYQWQVGTNNNWVTVANGGTISGATTPDLTFTSIGWTNTADYRMIATGSAGATTSIVARITVLSGLLNMANVGDPITAFGGTSGGTEGPEHTIDHVIQKCLINSGQATYVTPVGWVLTPSLGSTILNVLRFYTANDAEGRDPASYMLEGSNDGGTTWSLISSNALALPAGRNGTGNVALNPLTQTMQEIRFANTSDFTSYRLTIPTLKTANNGNPALMQIGEVEFLGVQKPVAPIITVEPVPSVTVFAGTTPALHVKATGFPTNLTYQWYQGANLISGATSASYTLPVVQLADSGKTFSCTVANIVGSTNSTSATLTVIAAPTQSYPVAIMADNPLAFWRLDEGPDDGAGNTGKVAKDYAGGNNGQYSYTTLGAQGYNPLIDSDTAATFGGFVDISGAVVDNYVGNIPDLDLYSPTNISRNFSAEAWVYGTAAQQVAGAGIVAAGYGSGGEQFAVDCGGANTAIRFYFRDVAGNAHGIESTNVANDSKWHHVVAVLDESNTNQTLYIDGLRAARATFAPGLGVRSQTTPLSIGSRKANATTNYNQNFVGSIDEVAIYGYALSSNQVLNHYYASQPAPQFSLQPTNSTVAENSSVTFYSSAYGPGTVTYQWFQSTDFGSTYTPMTGQTGPNLTLASVPATYNSYMYQVGAANAYGSNVSAIATLSVAAGAPYIMVDAPSSLLIYAGRTNSIAVSVGGSAPFTYQWSKDGAALSDGSVYSGTHSNVLTVSSAQLSHSGTYQLSVANAQGGPALSSPCTVLVQTRPGFNTNGFGWALNGNTSVATVDADTLTLTIGAGSTARSAWYTAPLYIGAFQAFFRYQDVGTGGADGATFCFQNDPRGVTALGGAGGGLGVTGITPSAELEFNIYNGNPLGIAYHENGATGGYTSSMPVDPSAGDPIGVVVRYVGGTMFITMTNQGGASFSTSVAADLPTVLGGSTAYVGFTGADGGTASTQVIRDFQFVPLPVLTAQAASPTTVLLTWPSTIGGYTLQSKSTLTGGTWQTVPVTTYGQALVTSTGQQFYRLVLP